MQDISACAWVKPIEFSVETKKWLGGLDWPHTAYQDFNQIGTHNDKVNAICGDQ